MTAHHPEQSFYNSLVADRDFKELINSSQYGLRSNDDKHILLAVNACVDIGEEAIPHLIEALDDFAIDALRVDREIQRRLFQGAPQPCQPPALALVRIGRVSVQPLIDYLKIEKDWISREAAVWALGELRDRRAVPCIRGIIRFFGFDRLSRTARSALRKINS